MLAALTPEVASQEVAQVLARVRGPSPPFDGGCVDIEPLNVPHRSRIDGSGSPLNELYSPTIPSTIDVTESDEVQELERRRSQRGLGYFDVHPERRRVHIGRHGDMMDQFAQAAGDLEALPRR
jgi:hypothetical protein